MDERQWLAESFEQHRTRLRAVAYRMLGSLPEADDAVQEAWLRLTRADTSDVENLGGWLTTVVARVSLNMLRSRTSRREETLEHSPGANMSEGNVGRADADDPEREAILADSVGLALLVVLEKLTPAERLAFVLHDVFAVPFEEIAPIVGRSQAATRQLASRARRRVRGADAIPDSELARQREVVDAFLVAARDGDFGTLVAVLDPEIVLQADHAAVIAGAATGIRGAREVAGKAVEAGARAARAALVDGEVGVVVAPRGRLLMVLRFMIRDGKIVEIDAIADPARLRQLDLTVLGD